MTLWMKSAFRRSWVFGEPTGGQWPLAGAEQIPRVVEPAVRADDEIASRWRRKGGVRLTN
jgi:hypothetical protein